MTQMQTNPGVPHQAPKSASQPPRTLGKARRGVIILMIASLLGTAVMQYVTQQFRTALVNPIGSTANLDNLSSFTLALLLGGLRGPLVMILWTTSESQKQRSDLEDFDTKIELIRRLQPEFDSVQMFQIWNKVYNTSVLMSSLANKYATVLDGLEYAEQINRDRPNNLNLTSSLAQVYFEKLGNSQEREYFIPRVRAESFAPIRLTMPLDRADDYAGMIRRLGMEQNQTTVRRNEKDKTATVIIDEAAYRTLVDTLKGPGVTYTNDDGWRIARTSQKPTRLDPRLVGADDPAHGLVRGDILPSLLAANPDLVRPANLAPEAEWNNGAPLQYLAKYQPFTYGLSPLAIGYNYYKSCQVLADVTHQRHMYISSMVVDDRPAVGLKLWSEDEAIWARRQEIRAWGGDGDNSRVASANTGYSAVPSMDKTFTTPLVSEAAVDEALFSYALCARLCDDAIAEYHRHVRHYPLGTNTYRQHMETVLAAKELALADLAYLKLAKLSQSGGSSDLRKELIADASKHYDEAIAKDEMLLLHFYIPDELLPPGYSHFTIGDQDHPISRQALDAAAGAAMAWLQDPRHRDPNDDRNEFQRYILRAKVRLKILAAN